jgi:hypothetical protein
MPSNVLVCRTCGELWERRGNEHTPYTCAPYPEHDFAPASYCALHDLYECPYAHKEDA